MKCGVFLLGALLLGLTPLACGSDDGDSGGSVTNAEYQQACANGVTLCKDHPTYGQMFGAQDCSTAAIETAYAVCDSACRANSKPIIDCQKAAADCVVFAACVQSP